MCQEDACRLEWFGGYVPEKGETVKVQWPRPAPCWSWTNERASATAFANAATKIQARCRGRGMTSPDRREQLCA